MTKKIAIIGSDKAEKFEEIVKFFEGINYNIDITCMYDKLNGALEQKAKDLKINSKYLSVEQIKEYLSANAFDLIVLTDFQSELTADIIELGKFVNIHPSLLPAFKGQDAIQRAFLAGVKVSGATVHWVTNDVDGGKIITQYPILINNSDHFDDFEMNIHKLENILYPVVIKSILEDRVFDFADLFQSSGCANGCSGDCGKCQK